MKSKLFLVAIFAMSIDCGRGHDKSDGSKYKTMEEDYHYTPDTSSLKLNFDSIMLELNDQLNDHLNDQLNDNEKEISIDGNLKDFARILSMNFNSAYKQCVKTEPESTKNSEEAYKMLVKKQCEKLIKPLLNQVQKTLEMLSKKKCKKYRSIFFSYLKGRAFYYINIITRNYTKKKVYKLEVERLLKSIAGQISSKNIEELKKVVIH